MTVARQQLGRRGETIAAEHLQAAGWRVLERNARTRYGEIDLVAREGSCLVFVEVKTLRADRGSGPLSPLESIGPRKQLQVRRLARAWLAETSSRQRYSEIRFDAIGVLLGAGVERVEHLRDAF